MMFAGRKNSVLDHKLGTVPTRDEVRDCLNLPKSMPMQHSHNETLSAAELEQMGALSQSDIREMMANEMDELPNIGEEPGKSKYILQDIYQLSIKYYLIISL